MIDRPYPVTGLGTPLAAPSSWYEHPTAPVPAAREIPATRPSRVVGVDGVRETER